MKNSHNNFEKEAKTAYKQKIESLEAETLHRLRLARESALSKQTRSLYFPTLNIKWLTSAGLALAGVLAFMVMPTLMSSSNLEDLEMYTVESDMDLVAQLEFYQWLDESSLSE